MTNQNAAYEPQGLELEGDDVSLTYRALEAYARSESDLAARTVLATAKRAHQHEVTGARALQVKIRDASTKAGARFPANGILATVGEFIEAGELVAFNARGRLVPWGKQRHGSCATQMGVAVDPMSIGEVAALDSGGWRVS